MVRKNITEEQREITEALDFIKRARKIAPPDNRIVNKFLDEEERTLHEDLFNCCFGKFNDVKEGT